MNTVLVIRPIHNAQRQAYEYKPIEVPAETAEDQLTKKDEQRNAAWRGVRYATDEEHNAYFKTAPKVKIEKAPESEEETEVNNQDVNQKYKHNETNIRYFHRPSQEGRCESLRCKPKRNTSPANSGS
jgi:hypothetical protein